MWNLVSSWHDSNLCTGNLNCNYGSLSHYMFSKYNYIDRTNWIIVFLYPKTSRRILTLRQMKEMDKHQRVSVIPSRSLAHSLKNTISHRWAITGKWFLSWWNSCLYNGSPSCRLCDADRWQQSGRKYISSWTYVQIKEVVYKNHNKARLRCARLLFVEIKIETNNEDASLLVSSDIALTRRQCFRPGAILVGLDFITEPIKTLLNGLKKELPTFHKALQQGKSQIVSFRHCLYWLHLKNI